MYNAVHVRNFKCFRDQKVALAPLSVMTGLNGTGKSSIIQSILVFKQSNEAHDNAVHLNGYWTTLGSFGDVLSFFDEDDDDISIKLLRDGSIFELEFSTDLSVPPRWFSSSP